MRHGRVPVQQQILHRQRVLSVEARYAVARHAVEAGGVLVRIRHAGVAPQRITVHGVPLTAELAREAEVAVAAAVGGGLGAEERGLEGTDDAGLGCGGGGGGAENEAGGREDGRVLHCGRLMIF